MFRFMRRVGVPRLGVFTRTYCTTPPESGKNVFNKSIDAVTNNPIMHDIRDALSEMQRRNYNIRMIKTGFIVMGGLVVFSFYEIFTGLFAKQTALITTEVLKDPKFQEETKVFCEGIIEQLVNSPKVLADVEKLANDIAFRLMENEAVKAQLCELFSEVFTSLPVKDAGGKLSEDVIKQLIEDPGYEGFREEIYEYLANKINRLTLDKTVQDDIGLLIRAGLSVALFGQSK